VKVGILSFERVLPRFQSQHPFGVSGCIPALKSRVLARDFSIKKVKNRCLKIVVEPEEDILVIITAYFDRTLKRKGLCE